VTSCHVIEVLCCACPVNTELVTAAPHFAAPSLLLLCRCTYAVIQPLQCCTSAPCLPVSNG
jgi:hypothetical protein